MASNLERYRSEIADLVERGTVLGLALRRDCSPQFAAQLAKQLGDTPGAASKIPSFGTGYQAWYSEAKALIRQLMPDRLSDFVGHYEPPKGRKELNGHSYRVSDCLVGHGTKDAYGKILSGPSSAIPHFDAQLAIVKAVESRFSSALFDIRQLVQADLFDSELDAARSLLGHGFARAAGAMCGVVLEHHLRGVCDAHQVTMGKKNPTIADFNEALKSAAVIEIAQWRHIQLLSDIRNKCDHKKSADPTVVEVTDLVDGVAKIIKTVH